MKPSNNKILITGSAGFIGFHLSRQLLYKGYEIFGLDSLNEYYEVKLKIDRNKILKKHSNYKFYKINIEDYKKLKKLIIKINPSIVIHLAAQAGVRYSVENPSVYFESNMKGTFNILDISRLINIEHLLIASTSSVYGSNKKFPFSENDKTDTQMSFYAASKKSCEIMAHSYSHIYNLPTTIFRFFTVYGPWGRPDMALFKFTKLILEDNFIEVYNYGKMKRDFTYVDDLVDAITKLKDKIPLKNKNLKFDSISNIAPFRIVNIGNNKTEGLMYFIKIIEKKLNKKAKIKFMDLQQGDVSKTVSDVSLLEKLIGPRLKTNIDIGVDKFIDWYIEYYRVKRHVKK